MSDLRERLLEAVANNRYDMHTKPFRFEGAVDALMPIIEAELQKRDQLLDQTIQVLDGAVRFIEAALVICARSCAPGDGLHVAWANDVCRKARRLSQKGRDEISR